MGERRDMWPDGPSRALVAAVAAFAVLRGIVAATTGLTDDEAYYRLWALAPAMSYLDHPPMVGWMIAAGRWIAGDNAFGIRFVALLASLIGPAILWRSTYLLFGPVVANRAVWIALAIPLLAVGGIIITPDTGSVLFAGLAAWALTELHVSRNPGWWLAVGVFAGLGLLSKYTNLFVGAGIVLWLAWGPGNWRWLRSWQLWAGGAIAAAITTPVLLWNAQHEWASFAKQFGRVGRGQGWTLTYTAEFIGAFFGLASPLIALLAVVGLAQVVAVAVRERRPAQVLLAAGLLPMLAYFLLHSLSSRVEANWPAPLYGALAVCAALAALAAAPAWLRYCARGALPVGFLLSALIYAHALVPLAVSAKDPTAQMRGWPAFAADIDRMRRDNGACWVATSSYSATGQLAFHLKGKAPVVQLTEPLRYVHLPPPDAKLLACPALYVDLVKRSAPEVLQPRFASIKPMGEIVRSYGRVPLARYTIYLVSKPLAAKVQF